MSSEEKNRALVLRDSQGRCYRIPVDALQQFKVSDEESTKLGEKFGAGDVAGQGKCNLPCGDPTDIVQTCSCSG